MTKRPILETQEVDQQNIFIYSYIQLYWYIHKFIYFRHKYTLFLNSLIKSLLGWWIEMTGDEMDQTEPTYIKRNSATVEVLV